MLMHIWNYLRNQKGQGMVEYGLIIALVGVIVAGSLTLMQGSLTNLFSGLSDKLKP